MSDEPKLQSISDGPNSRPRDTSIAQSAGGLPDDTGRPIPLSEAEERRMADKLVGKDEDAEPEAHPS
ncbi:hypothetical protein [Aureimonas sp. AU20]|uniref:hypothetical protein n=1 Tax=Aureimonas sp. AU20 TaxID=1349819 RepID=UPI00071FBECD|nr:hypothetical protein [Aureimonas sp. AU20]ALN74266.1 hypothetical protein M673_16185 [Aureimonas sp. AU20]